MWKKTMKMKNFFKNKTLHRKVRDFFYWRYFFKKFCQRKMFKDGSSFQLEILDIAREFNIKIGEWRLNLQLHGLLE